MCTTSVAAYVEWSLVLVVGCEMTAKWFSKVGLSVPLV